MTERFSLDQIRDFWNRQAEEHGQAPAASWSDHWVIDLENREIVSRLNDGDQVLDVGCGTGYSTVRFACQRRIDIRGIDYVPEMIEQARLRLDQNADKLVGSVKWAVGDVTTLDGPAGFYDKVVSIRVIINLGEWERQREALLRCARLVKPGGLFLLSEATVQGWNRLNAMRREWGLPDISMPPFNNYLDQNAVVDALSSDLELVELVNFASTYFWGTRLLKPLLIKATGANVDVANPDTEWNRWFAQLPAWGDCGTQKLFVFRKL